MKAQNDTMYQMTPQHDGIQVYGSISASRSGLVLELSYPHI